MYIFSLILLIVLFLIVLVLIFFVCLLLWPIFTWFKKAPYVPSFDTDLLLIKKHITFKKWDSIVDLWCGDGKVLRFFSQYFWLKGVWYDSNPFVIFYGKILNIVFGYKDIRLVRSDFVHANLDYYDYVFLYLFPEQVLDMEDWIFSSVSENTIILSNSFAFFYHVPFKIILDENNTKIIYLYRI